MAYGFQVTKARKLTAVGKDEVHSFLGSVINVHLPVLALGWGIQGK